MAIKRFTIELDDSPDIARGTAPPVSLIGKKTVSPEKNQKTGTPEEQDDYRKQEATEKEQNGARISETIGRTPSDLVFTFINRPEFIVTAFTFLSFLIFIGKLQQLNDFWLPIVASFVLNVVWFGIVTIRRIANRFRKE